MSVDFVEVSEDLSGSPLWNPDLAPTPLSRRTWSTYHIAALWIGMSVVITTYTLASGLMQQGMTWWQAMLTILLGNVDRAGADDPQRPCRHEVRHVVSGAVPRQLRRARREHSGDPAGDRRLRLVRHSDVDWRAGVEHAARRGVAGAGAACRATCGSRSRCSGLVQVWHHPPRPRGHQEARRLVGAAAAGGGALLLLVGVRRGGGLGYILERIGAAADGARAVLAAVSRRADGQRRLLGDPQPEHPGLHPLRAQPAVAGARTGARPAGDDDRVRVHRRRGDERHDRDLRRSDLGSGGADRAHRHRRRSSSSARWSCCWRS